MMDNVMVCRMLAVRMPERAQHALDRNPRGVHRERVAIEPLELKGVPYPFERCVVVVGRS